MVLTGKQKKYLRGLAHSLKPLVHIGKGGLSEGVVQETRAALEAHELVKLKFGGSFEGEKSSALETLLSETEAQLAGTLGHTAVIYRERDEDPEIKLP